MKCPFCEQSCGHDWCAYKDVEVTNNEFEVTKKEAFEIGRIEGLKEAFNEILDMTETDIKFFRVYVKARLKSVSENIINIEKFKKGLK